MYAHNFFTQDLFVKKLLTELEIKQNVSWIKFNVKFSLRFKFSESITHQLFDTQVTC